MLGWGGSRREGRENIFFFSPSPPPPFFLQPNTQSSSADKIQNGARSTYKKQVFTQNTCSTLQARRFPFHHYFQLNQLKCKHIMQGYAVYFPEQTDDLLRYSTFSGGPFAQKFPLSCAVAYVFLSSNETSSLRLIALTEKAFPFGKGNFQN